MNLNGRRVLVTGATSGIGLATVRRLVALGASVWAMGRNAERLARLEAEGLNGGAALAFDLIDVEAYRAFA